MIPLFSSLEEKMKEKITIDSPSDIQVGNSYTIHNAIVHKIESEGNPDSKVPAVLVFKLEQGGFIKISSWQYDKLDIVKKAMKRLTVRSVWMTIRIFSIRFGHLRKPAGSGSV